ncbi:SDR family oxidoreductase [Acidocella aquatica]|uniref:SDR family oxidoreductase n=1 Tax=Acidocella aquatica TaxID=1922313 RepID=A0ABQ6A7Q0_9PROT|nr:SDR family NAD(P)-dependent oxidoreductase [Acidocella aquatica]GLR67658.1 SDR family oxidoreductase [Acidocella aquatica]
MGSTPQAKDPYAPSAAYTRDCMSQIVIGASGGLGAAFLQALGPTAIGFSRTSTPPLNLEDEASIAAAAAASLGRPPTLIIDATGFLHGGGFMPEKTFAALSPEHMARSFAINAIGPALLLKHFLPLLPRGERAVFVSLSAKVGSIGDNQSGGWYSYRAAKAALNQIIHTAAIELRHKRPDAICLAMHPGTVSTPLSAPFAKTGLNVRPPEEAAAGMLSVISRLTPADSGKFLAYNGAELPW